MADESPTRTLLDFTLRGLDELERFPTPDARVRAMRELGAAVRGWELVKGVALCASGVIVVMVLARTLLPRVLPGTISRHLIQDASWLLGFVTFLAMVRFLHRRGAARELRPMLIEAGVPVCVECGYALHGLPRTLALCPECGSEITEGARRLLNEWDAA